MKTCQKCGGMMIDGDIHTSFGNAYVSVPGSWRRKNLGKVECKICANCGAVDLSVDIPQNINLASYIDEQ